MAQTRAVARGFHTRSAESRMESGEGGGGDARGQTAGEAARSKSPRFPTAPAWPARPLRGRIHTQSQVKPYAHHSHTLRAAGRGRGGTINRHPPTETARRPEGKLRAGDHAEGRRHTKQRLREDDGRAGGVGGGGARPGDSIIRHGLKCSACSLSIFNRKQQCNCLEGTVTAVRAWTPWSHSAMRLPCLVVHASRRAGRQSFRR